MVDRASDVARQFAHLPGGQASRAVATHLTKFWEWGMLRELVDQVRADAVGTDALVERATREVIARHVNERQLREPSGG